MTGEDDGIYTFSQMQLLKISVFEANKAFGVHTCGEMLGPPERPRQQLGSSDTRISKSLRCELRFLALVASIVRL